MVDQLQATIDGLRKETGEANDVVSKLRAEIEEARRANEELREQLTTAMAERESASADGQRLHREREDLSRRVSELEQLLGQSRHDALTAGQEAAEKVAAAERERDELRTELRGQLRTAEDRARDVEGELTEAKQRADVAESALADTRETLTALEAEHAGLVRTLADERDLGERRVEEALATLRSQHEADRTAWLAETQKLRTESDDLRAQLAEAEARSEREAAFHLEEASRVREGVSGVIADAMQRLVDGVADVVGSGPAVSVVANEPTATGEALVPPGLSEVAPAAGNEWDQLLTNLEALRSEVEDFRPESLLPDTDLHAFDALEDDRPTEERPLPENPDHENTGTGSMIDTPGAPAGTQTLHVDPDSVVDSVDDLGLSVTGTQDPVPSDPEADGADAHQSGAEGAPPKKRRGRRRSRRSKKS